MVNNYMEGIDMSNDFNVLFGDEIECPFCHSKNTMITNSNYISKKIKKDDVRQNGGVFQYEPELVQYKRISILCCDCGQISESIDKKDLERFKNDKEKFV